MKKHREFWWFEKRNLDVPPFIAWNLSDTEMALETNCANWKSCREQLWAEREGLA